MPTRAPTRPARANGRIPITSAAEVSRHISNRGGSAAIVSCGSVLPAGIVPTFMLKSSPAHGSSMGKMSTVVLAGQVRYRPTVLPRRLWQLIISQVIDRRNHPVAGGKVMRWRVVMLRRHTPNRDSRNFPTARRATWRCSLPSP